jgi:signal transduction histidine kinase
MPLVETDSSIAGPPEGAQPARTASPRLSPDLLSSICHDLKAPLASIVMGAGYLLQVLPPEDKSARRVADAMRRASERMSQLVVSFSDLAKLEMHELVLQRRAYEVQSLVQAAYDLAARDAEAQGVSFSLALAAEAGGLRVECDRDRLLQAFRHLAACALRVVPDGGTTTLRVTVEGDGRVLFVLEAVPRSGPEARRISTELPKPDLAIGTGLVALHGSELEVELSGERAALSFVLESSPR